MDRHERRRQAREAARPKVLNDPGPFRGLPGTKWEGLTNEDVMAIIAEALGGPPKRGELYRLSVGQGTHGQPAGFIAEYVDTGREFYGNGRAEYALRFIIRNPKLPPHAENGTADNPYVVWPLDILHLSPAQPGDMDTPYRLVEAMELPDGTIVPVGEAIN